MSRLMYVTYENNQLEAGILQIYEIKESYRIALSYSNLRSTLLFLHLSV